MWINSRISRRRKNSKHTLEIVASLAVRMDKRRYALGLVTNGALVGGGPAIVPIARNRQQLPAILEVLARLQMESKGDLIDTLRRGLEVHWGMSCRSLFLRRGWDSLGCRAVL